MDCPIEDCEENEEWNSVTGQCEWVGTSGWQWDSSSCHRPENSCPSGTCCCDNGICTTGCCDDGGGGGGDPFEPDPEETTCPPGKVMGPDGVCRGVR